MRTPLFAIVGLLLAISGSGQVKQEKQVAELAFAVPEQGEQTLRQLRGKVVALELISTACLACEDSVRILGAIQKEFGTARFQSLAVAVNPNAEVSAPSFARDQKVMFPVGWTTREEARKLMDIGPEDRFALPQVLVIDANGQIRYRTAAMGTDSLRTENTLRQRVQFLLNPAPPKANSVPAKQK
jgi:hypothetical protein